MRIEQDVEVSVPMTQVWDFLDDVPRVAACMPGATLTEVVDDRTYEGLVAVKVGPISMTYHGTVIIEDKDPHSHTVRMHATGKDRKGAGSAKAQIVARLAERSEETTKLSVVSDVQLTGRAASLGRGVQDVANKIFAEFAERMRGELTGPSHEEAGEHVLTGPEPKAAGCPQQLTASGTARPSPSVISPSSAPAPSSNGGGAPARNEIKLGRLVWSVIQERLSRLLARFRRVR